MLFVAAAALASMILILIHHIHFLMYVPTIAAIVVLRLLSGSRRQPAERGRGDRGLRERGLAVSGVQFYGSMAVPEDRFIDYLRGRMADPSQTRLLSFSLYLVPAACHGNSRHLGAHAVQSAGRSGVRAADLAAHAAVEIFCGTDPGAVGRLASPRRHRRDRRCKRGLSHHVRDGVRLFAVDFELGGLHVPDPARGEDAAGSEVTPVAADDRRNRMFGWIVTLIPRVGIVRPF
jgi:hypothetical protein